jgi:hypothetical protein
MFDEAILDDYPMMDTDVSLTEYPVEPGYPDLDW